jgi:hypothetical protein
MNVKIWLLGIVLLGISLRMININNPLVERGGWVRQADTAAIARNFYDGNFNILYPQIDWRGTSSGYVECEFQFFTFIIALLYKIFGVKEIFRYKNCPFVYYLLYYLSS